MAVGLLTGTFSVLGPSADAATTLPGSPYDGTDGENDWYAEHASIIEIPDPVQGSGDDSFLQGSNTGKEKDNCSRVGTGGVQPNNDLVNFYIGAETVGGATFLYLGFERDLPQGESVTQANFLVSFELNQGQEACDQGPLVHRTDGDLLFAYNGSNPNQIELSVWDSGRWGKPSNPSDPGSEPLSGAAAEASMSDDHLFGEAVVNLNAAGVISGDDCTSFTSAFAKTRSSWSGGESTLKDIVGPDGVEVSNCGRLVVEKLVTGDDEGDELFDFEVECGGPRYEGALEFDFQLADGGSWPDNVHVEEADLPDHEPDDNLLFYGTTCSVTETADLDGTWTTTFVVKVNGTVDGDLTGDGEGTEVEDIEIVDGTIVVTFTNDRNVPPDPGTLTVSKIVAGDEDPEAPEDFAFEVVCGEEEGAESVTFSLGDGDSWPSDDVTPEPDDGTNESFTEETSCTVTETELLGPDWTTTYEVKVDGDVDEDATGDGGGDSVTVTVDADTAVEVIFTNTYVAPPGTLRVSKVVAGSSNPPVTSFDFEVECDEEPITEFSLSEGQSWHSEAVPGAPEHDGSFDESVTCSVEETEELGATWSTSWVVLVDGEEEDSGMGSVAADVDVNPDTKVEVIFTNTYTRPTTTTIIIDTTTTTVPPTTTTVPPTTTTEPEPTTTTIEPEVEPVVIEQTTTTVPTEVLGVVEERELPRTGGDIGALLLLAGIAMLLGGLALAFERPLASERRRRL